MASQLGDLLDKTADSARALDEVGAYLGRLRRDRLVELLLEHARDDERLAIRLCLLALRAANEPGNIETYRWLIDRAIALRDSARHREAVGRVSVIEESIDALDGLLDDGRTAEVVALTEHALAGLESSIGRGDDPGDGGRDLLERLQRLHYAACLREEPDPVELAEKLFVWELGSEHGVFAGAAAQYAEVLGAAGIARYQELADERWASVPALGPGQEKPEDGERARLTRIMVTLAEQSGDVERLVAVRSRDLSTPEDFLRIAELYREHGDPDKALEWAERGVAAFKPSEPRLRTFAAEEYRRRGRAYEALEQAWLAFRDRPELETYRQLKDDAEAVDEWSHRRKAALGLLANGAGGRGVSWLPGHDGSEVVRIFLWEDDEEAAWRHANERGCSDELWLDLAARRREKHPEDALRVYERLLESAIAGGRRDAYRRAVSLMDEIRAVLEQMGKQDTFSRYVERLREARKRKRTLGEAFKRDEGSPVPPDALKSLLSVPPNSQ